MIRSHARTRDPCLIGCDESYYWISSELLTHLGFLLALVFLANLLKQKRSPSSTIAWLLVILLLPYVGVPLYVMFGGRKMNTMARRKSRIYNRIRPAKERASGGSIERLLASYGVPPAREGNRIELVTSGTDAYRRILAMIERGQVHASTSRPTSSDGMKEAGRCWIAWPNGPATGFRCVCSSTTWDPGGFPGVNWRH